MCLVEFKKEQLDKNRKLIELKNSLKNVFYSVLKQKNIFNKHLFKRSSHL